MNVLVVDVGGTHVKILATGQQQSREFPSGPTLTAEQMVASVKQLAGDWKYDAVSIGYPGPVIKRGRMAPSGARPSTGPEKRSAPRAGQRLAGAVASRWRPPARSLRGRDRRY